MRHPVAELLFLAACADTRPAAECTWDSPCAMEVAEEVAPPSVLSVNAFDAPWFEAWSSDREGSVTRWVAGHAGHWVPLAPTGLSGRHPVAAWNPADGLLRLCREVPGGIGCARSADGQGWRDDGRLSVPADASGLSPVALYDDGVQAELLLAVSAWDRVTLRVASSDGGRAWHLAADDLAELAPGPTWAVSEGDPVPTAFLLPAADGIRRVRREQSGWIAGPVLGELPPRPLAGATFFGQAAVWEVQ